MGLFQNKKIFILRRSLFDYKKKLWIELRLELSRIVKEVRIIERDILYNMSNFDEYKLEFDELDLSLINKLPKYMALLYKIIPIKIIDRKVFIAMAEPKMDVYDYLRFVYKREPVILRCEENIILEAIEKVYSEEYVKGMYTLEKSKYKKNENLPISTIEFVDNILGNAIMMNASDIHLEPCRDFVQIRYRVDGILRYVRKINHDEYSYVLGRLKVMSNMNVIERRVPQDGKFQYQFQNKKYDFRASTLPLVYGEKIVIRILYKDESLITLNAIGFSSQDILTIRKMISKGSGIILVTGPTGSGKSTTLYAMLNELDKTNYNILTIEDPVEFTIDNINQMNVSPNVSFATGLKNMLRQDPDIIMVGEIRDEETAEIAIRAAITGHLVLSTLHTRDAVSAILRLINMGIPKYLISDALTGVISQRLVRKVCTNCIHKDETKLLLNGLEHTYKGKGCAKCEYSGYKGRTICYEIMYLEKAHREIIQGLNDIQKLYDYNSSKNMICLQDNCLDLVKRGIISCEEYYRLWGTDSNGELHI